MSLHAEQKPHKPFKWWNLSFGKRSDPHTWTSLCKLERRGKMMVGRSWKVFYSSKQWIQRAAAVTMKSHQQYPCCHAMISAGPVQDSGSSIDSQHCFISQKRKTAEQKTLLGCWTFGGTENRGIFFMRWETSWYKSIEEWHHARPKSLERYCCKDLIDGFFLIGLSKAKKSRNCCFPFFFLISECLILLCVSCQWFVWAFSKPPSH